MRYWILFLPFIFLVGGEMDLGELAKSGRSLQLSQVQLPGHSKILYVPTPGVELTLIDQLKERGNEVVEVGPESLGTEAADMVVIPEGMGFEKNGLAIEYETPLPDPNFLTVVLTHRELRRKVEAMERFHRSQVERTDFAGIIQEMAHDAGGGERFTIDLRTIGPDDRLVVVAPHPDDAEIGAGGLIQRIAKAGVSVEVWNLTSGHRARIFRNGSEVTDHDLKRRIREKESTNALEFLNSSVQVHCLNLPFYDNGYQLSEADRQPIKERLKPGMIFLTPYPDDAHAAHRAATQLIFEVLDNHSTVVHGHYCTPWTGSWNLYSYGNRGSRLAALVGGERLAGKGEKALTLKELGGDRAERYRVFRVK